MPLEKELQNLVDSLIRAANAADLSGEATRSAEDKYVAISVQYKKTNDTLFKYIKNLKEYYKIQKKGLKDLVNISKDQKKNREELEKLRKTVERQSAPLKTMVSDLGKVTAGFKSVVGAAAKMAGSVGAVSFGFTSLADTTFKYNKALLSVSRMQRVAGSGSSDLGKTLQYVSKQTAMSQMQFLDLASTMQETFIGVKPSAMKMAQVIETIGEQFGYNYDKAKDFASIQASFPQLYDKIEEGLEAIARINKGIGTNDDIKRAAAVKEWGNSYVLAVGAGSKAMTDLQQALTPMTESEKKYNEVLRERAKLTKELSDLQLGLSQTLQPVLMEGLRGATQLINKLSEFRETIVIVGGLSVALRGVYAVTKAWKAISVAAFGPWGIALAAVVAVGIAIGGMIGKQRKAREEAERQKKASEENAIVQREISGLTDAQRKKYNEIAAKRKEDGRTIGDTLADHKETFKEVKLQAASTDKLSLKHQEIEQIVKTQLEMQNKITAALNATVSSSEKFGATAKDALEGLVTASKQKFKSAGKEFSSALGLAMGDIDKYFPDMKLDMSGDVSKQQQQLSEMYNSLEEMNVTEAERVSIRQKLTTALNASTKVIAEEEAIVSGTNSLMTMRIRQQEQSTSKYEARLDAERKLMESAQFGLGASVEMMKKQVDLAYEMQQTYVEADKNWANQLISSGLITKEQLKQIQNARTAAEAENYIKNTLSKSGEEMKLLTDYAQNHQDISKKTMEQQQKIYDLTKDIREGYLDAIREMSVGAGEFEKIIGTQEMGTTQLMKNVKDVTGVAKLNTMALGGLQEQVLSAKGVGTGVAGQYGKSGISFIGSKEQERRNQRIYNYDKYKKEAESAMRGEVPDRKSTVGGASVEGMETYVAPERTGEIIGEVGGKTFGEVAGREFSKRVLGINPSVVNRGYAVGAEDVKKIQSHPGNINPQTRSYMGAGGTYERASGGVVIGAPVTHLNVPNSGPANKTRGSGTGQKQSGTSTKGVATNTNNKQKVNKFDELMMGFQKDYIHDLSKASDKDFEGMKKKIYSTHSMRKKDVENLKVLIKSEEDEKAKALDGYHANRGSWGKTFGTKENEKALEARSEVERLDRSIANKKDRLQASAGELKQAAGDVSAVQMAVNTRENSRVMEQDKKWKYQKDQISKKEKEEANRKKVQSRIDKEKEDARQGFFRGVKQSGEKGLLTPAPGRDASKEERESYKRMQAGYKASSARKAEALRRGYGTKEIKEIKEKTMREIGEEKKEAFLKEERRGNLRIKRDEGKKLRSKLSPEELAEVKKTEEMMAMDKSGTLSKSQRSELTKRLGYGTKGYSGSRPDTKGPSTLAMSEYYQKLQEFQGLNNEIGAVGSISSSPEKSRGGPIDPVTAQAFEYMKRIGAVKGGNREAKAAEIKKQMTQIGLKEGLGDTMEEYQQQKKIRQRTADIGSAGLKAPGMDNIAVVEQQRTSAEVKEGLVASKSSQQAFEGKSQEIEAKYGTMSESGGGGGGGAGVATVRIILGKGLEAQLENANNVAVEIQNAAQ